MRKVHHTYTGSCQYAPQNKHILYAYETGGLMTQLFVLLQMTHLISGECVERDHSQVWEHSVTERSTLNIFS